MCQSRMSPRTGRVSGRRPAGPGTPGPPSTLGGPRSVGDRPSRRPPPLIPASTTASMTPMPEAGRRSPSGAGLGRHAETSQLLRVPRGARAAVAAVGGELDDLEPSISPVALRPFVGDRFSNLRRSASCPLRCPTRDRPTRLTPSGLAVVSPVARRVRRRVGAARRSLPLRPMVGAARTGRQSRRSPASPLRCGQATGGRAPRAGGVSSPRRDLARRSPDARQGR